MPHGRVFGKGIPAGNSSQTAGVEIELMKVPGEVTG